ncbi:MAG: hypothetical protein OHK0023_15540 [Anaerolineae bacterium]
MLKKLAFAAIVVAYAAVALPFAVNAQVKPMVEVYDQAMSTNSVIVKTVVAAEPGWIVIHAGSEGFPVVGYTYVPAGTTENVRVQVDMSGATPQMSAMLHVDKGESGKYEFPGADVPVPGDDGKPINPPFKVIAAVVDDQFVVDNTVTVKTVISQADGWIVIHAGSEGFPVIGQAAVKAGVNLDVKVTIDKPDLITPRMTAMLHDDAGTLGTYEFPGADVPTNLQASLQPFLGGGIVNTPFWTVEYVRTAPQLIGDGDMVVVPSVLTKADGWMVIHATSEGNPVIGQAPVKAGLNTNVMVQVDKSKVTPELLAMLHVDAGTLGTYEFPGADVPVQDAEGKVIAPPFNVTLTVQSVNQPAANGLAGVVVVPIISSPVNRWMVIHATTEGNPVIGQQFVPAGVSFDLVVKIDPTKLSPELIAMLHDDLGQPGVYEFPGPDVPTRVGEQLVAPRFRLE